MLNEATNKAAREQWIDRINARDLDGALHLISPTIFSHAPGRDSGVEGIRQWFELLFAAFPDMRSTTQHLVAEGDMVVHHMLVEATHSGPFMGMPPTGKHARWAVIDVVRFEDGKMAEHWTISDTLGMMQQLGVMDAS
jgi:predicted ester cyclase